MAESKTKMSRTDLLAKVREIVRASTNDPVAEMRAMGETLIKMADALEGKSGPEVRATIEAVATMEGISIH